MLGEVPVTVEILKAICDDVTGEEGYLPPEELFTGKTISGKGEVRFKNGNIYKGDVENGILDGNGTFLWKDGVTFKGDFRNNKMDGQGTYQWPDGSTYTGQIQNGLRHGKGTFKTTAGKENLTYTGDWREGLKHGKGELMYHSTGTTYKGDFQHGFKHGHGKMVYASGNYYEGEWKFDKKSGFGEMRWLTSGETYTGYWEENKQNGFGVHVWLEEPGKLKSLRNRYEGMWFNGTRNGYGTFYYSDGSRYDGEWVSNLKEGFALFTDPNGDVAESIFKNDRVFLRLNEPRKIHMTAIVEDGSEDSTEDKPSRAKSKGKGANKPKTAARPNSKGPTQSNPDQKQTTKAAPAVPNARDAKRKQKKNGESEVDQETIAVNKEVEFAKKNLENQVLNPYLQILRVDDLLETVRDKEEVLSGLEIGLLHHNSMFMDVFKEYKALPSNVNELAYTMNLRAMWTFLRNSRILSPSLSLAVFNRYFYQNPSNFFHMRFDFDGLRKKIRDLKLKHYSTNQRKLEVLKKLDVYIRNNEVMVSFDKLNYSPNKNEFSESVLKVDEHHKYQYEEDPIEKIIMEQVEKMKVPRFNVHEPNNIVQFRNFIDGVIRAVYIRENFDFNNIGYNLDKKYIKYRIEPIVHAKSHLLGKTFGYEEEEKLKSFSEDYRVEHLAELQQLFLKHLSNRISKLNEPKVHEHTSDVKSLRALLKSAGMISNPQEELKFFKVMERYLDPDSSYVELLTNKLDLGKHFNRLQTLELISNPGESIDLDNSQMMQYAIPSSGELIKLERVEADNENNKKSDSDKRLEARVLQGQKSGQIEEESDLGDRKASKTFDGSPILKASGDQTYEFSANVSPNPTNQVISPLELKAIDTTEIGKRLGALLGHELLYFEFVDSLLLYLLITDRIKLHYEQMRKVLGQLLSLPGNHHHKSQATRKRWLGTETDRKEYQEAKKRHYLKQYEEYRSKVNGSKNVEESKMMKENDIDIIKLMEANAAAEKKRKSKQPAKKPAPAAAKPAPQAKK
jgi:hypothetical protein